MWSPAAVSPGAATAMDSLQKSARITGPFLAKASVHALPPTDEKHGKDRPATTGEESFPRKMKKPRKPKLPGPEYGGEIGI